MSAKRSPLRHLLRTTLISLAVVGFGCSFYYNQRLSRLRETHADLRKRVGLLDVTDASKVAVMHVPVPDDVIPPGVEEAYAWQFRLYLPANYGPCFQTKRGLVKADSPQGQGGSGSSWSTPRPEPEEALATIAFIKSDGQWIFCRTTGGSSSSSSMPNDFSFGSLDDFVIDQVVKEGETRTFDTDEGICLFRMREKEMAKNRKGKVEEDLYRGFVVYLFSHKHQDAFKAWANGEADSMKESQQ